MRILISACLSLVLGCTASVHAAAPGTLEGHLAIAEHKEVDLAGGDAQGTADRADAEYPLVVMSGDGKKQIARVTVDGDGKYRASLPPGDYVLDVENRAQHHLRATPKRFTIVSRQTARVDMEIDTGVR
ncbi:MAG TPA: carboxypeptidase-like regulatory domain-containing protein [Thermoanaerobaculia bacterium]